MVVVVVVVVGGGDVWRQDFLCFLYPLGRQPKLGKINFGNKFITADQRRQRVLWHAKHVILNIVVTLFVPVYCCKNCPHY